MDTPNMKKPCINCPFRKDTLKGWLGKEYMTNIIKADAFVCHKTAYKDDNAKKQCAGHLIVVEHNAYRQIAERLGIDIGLIDEGICFESTEDAIKHHS